jgi:hypothetical protein
MPNFSANLSKCMPRADVCHRLIKQAGGLSAALMLTLLALTMPALAADKPIVIKFSHVAAMGTPKSKAIEHFKQLAERKTAGKVRVDVYPNSTLYKDKEELEALQMGAVQMLAPTLSNSVRWAYANSKSSICLFCLTTGRHCGVWWTGRSGSGYSAFWKPRACGVWLIGTWVSR